MKPLAITMGEPNSISTYLVVKAWKEQVHPFLYIGHEKLAKEISNSVPVKLIQNPKQATKIFEFALPVLPLQNQVHGSLHVHSDKDSAAIRESIETAVTLASQKEVSAIVTSPIQKKSLQMEGKGQTEYIAKLLHAKEFAMMAMDKNLRVVLVTSHVPIKKISLTTSQIRAKILITTRFLEEKLAIDNPRIGVLGLNPHAGEHCLIGREDHDIILPACQGDNIFGPLSADGAFCNRENYDAIIAMYHDQGLAPFKCATKAGVNTTIGLPIVRTSPMHGTGSDLVNNLDLVNCSSFIQAIEMAHQLSSSDVKT